MLYYKGKGCYYASQNPPKKMDGLEQITEEEYNQVMQELSEEVITREKAEKEELFLQLKKELYPEEE